MRKIKIYFSDFWNGFDFEDNFFINLIKRKYNVELSAKPDILIYSNRGLNFLKYNCLKVFYNGENVRPDFRFCDFSFSFEYGGGPKNYRLPLYALYDDVSKLTAPKDVEAIIKKKSKFCNFIYSNPRAEERIQFFKLLNQYKKVDSAGEVLNNIGYSIGKFPSDKRRFISEYKFTIAFENSSYSGYTTEKIFEPMLVDSIPVYWGSPQVEREFNVKSFVNVHDFSSFQEVVEHIIQIDQDDDLYRQYLSEPYFHNNLVPENLLNENILTQLDYIIGSVDKIKPVSSTFQGFVNRHIKMMQPYVRKGLRSIKVNG